MRKVIVLSALLLITGMSVYAQEDYSKSLKTTTTIVVFITIEQPKLIRNIRV